MPTWCERQEGRPVIADSAAVGVDTEKVIEATGYSKLREKGYEVIDLKARPRVKRAIPEGQVLREVTTFDLVEEAKAIISVPVMKTHDQTEITLALKNLKGLIDDKDKRRLHQEGVLQGVLDLYQAFQPRLRRWWMAPSARRGWARFMAIRWR